MLPVLPEVLSVMAGLVGMHPVRFGLAITLGSVPPAVVFAWVGASATESPGMALFVLTVITVLLWWMMVRWSRLADSAEKD